MNNGDAKEKYTLQKTEPSKNRKRYSEKWMYRTVLNSQNWNRVWEKVAEDKVERLQKLYPMELVRHVSDFSPCTKAESRQ